MANDNGYPRRILMVLLFVSSGLGGVPEGVKKSGLEPSSAQGPLRRVCEAILVPKQADGALKNEILGVARRSARRRWGDIGGLKYLHLSCVFGERWCDLARPLPCLRQGAADRSAHSAGPL